MACASHELLTARVWASSLPGFLVQATQCPLSCSGLHASLACVNMSTVACLIWELSGQIVGQAAGLRHSPTVPTMDCLAQHAWCGHQAWSQDTAQEAVARPHLEGAPAAQPAHQEAPFPLGQTSWPSGD